jgi:hypothetical protein
VEVPLEGGSGAGPFKSKKKVSKQKVDTKVLSQDDLHDPNYSTASESDDNRVGGAKLHGLLKEISVPYWQKVKEGEKKKRVRCLGSKGCGITWKWPRARQRIFKHAKDCQYLPVGLHRKVRDEMAKNAVGPKAQVEVDNNGEASETEVEVVETGRGLKRAKTDSAITSTLNSGKAFGGFVREGRKALQDRATHALLLFITCCGVPPKVVDSLEFKNFVSVLNSDYSPPSETTLSDRYIPDEAANVDTATIAYLKTCRNLTITFDGGKLRSANGLYSVHVTTPDRRTFCMTLDDASRLSHTGEYIAELLERVSHTRTHTDT